MAYRIEVAPRAERQFKELPQQARARLASRIDALAGNPRPAGAEKLSGSEDLYRIRAGDYRVIYAVRDELLLVLIAGVGHRRDVYRRLRR